MYISETFRSVRQKFVSAYIVLGALRASIHQGYADMLSEKALQVKIALPREDLMNLTGRGL